MKRYLLASLMLFSISLNAVAQSGVAKPATATQASADKVKSFYEKVTSAVEAINNKDVVVAQSRIAVVVGLMMDRANDLSIEKAPQGEVDSRRKQGQQLKYLSIDPVANKAELLKLLKEMQSNY